MILRLKNSHLTPPWEYLEYALGDVMMRCLPVCRFTRQLNLGSAEFSSTRFTTYTVATGYTGIEATVEHVSFSALNSK
jgi:hypothetical protein